VKLLNIIKNVVCVEKIFYPLGLIKCFVQNCVLVGTLTPPKGKHTTGYYLPCQNCQKQVWTTPFRKQYKKRFCSNHCRMDFQKKNSFKFECAVCGKFVFTQPAQIKLRSRKTCSIECRSKFSRLMANKRRVELGYTKHQIDRLQRYSVEAGKWRDSVFKRDNYTCQICCVRGSYLEADHIKPWAYFPELRFEISNGRTLCRKCHDKTKISYKKMREIYT
jgi:hypothetical protein